MTFDIPANRTVNASGEKTVMIKTTGHERIHFTVVLSCLADRTKLHPVVIFKRKTLSKGAKFPQGVTVKAHPKGWMDIDGTKEWLNSLEQKSRCFTWQAWHDGLGYVSGAHYSYR